MICLHWKQCASEVTVHLCGPLEQAPLERQGIVDLLIAPRCVAALGQSINRELGFAAVVYVVQQPADVHIDRWSNHRRWLWCAFHCRLQFDAAMSTLQL